MSESHVVEETGCNMGLMASADLSLESTGLCVVAMVGSPWNCQPNFLFCILERCSASLAGFGEWREIKGQIFGRGLSLLLGTVKGQWAQRVGDMCHGTGPRNTA